MMNRRPISIYLVREGWESPDQVLSNHDKLNTILLQDGQFEATMYWRSKTLEAPNWVAQLRQYTSEDLDELKGASSSAVVLRQVSERLFAIPFGHGWRMLDPSAIEQNFGLRIVLNSVTSTSLRALDAKSFEGATISHRRQSSKNVTVHGMGVDTDRNLISAATGTPTNTSFWGKTLDGKDAVRFVTNKRLDELDTYLEAALESSQSDSYKEEHPWVDRISMVRDASKKQELLVHLVEKLNLREFDTLWLAPPTTIDRMELEGFSYKDLKNANIYSELDCHEMASELYPNTPFDTTKLSKAKVYAKRSGDDVHDVKWRLLDCIQCEIVEDGNVYFLNDGDWYTVQASYLDQMDSELEHLFVQDTWLPKCEGKSEGDYNAHVANALSPTVQLMDQRLIDLGKDYTGIEFSDLMHENRHITHVKHYSGSSTLSHLFNQGLNSAILIKSYPDFREKANELLDEHMRLPGRSDPIQPNEYTVVYGIIRSGGFASRKLPLFSRVTLNRVARQLRGMDLKVEVHMIDGTPAPKKSKEAIPE